MPTQMRIFKEQMAIQPESLRFLMELNIVPFCFSR